MTQMSIKTLELQHASLEACVPRTRRRSLREREVSRGLTANERRAPCAALVIVEDTENLSPRAARFVIGSNSPRA
jgi:hypothetical protein